MVYKSKLSVHIGINESDVKGRILFDHARAETLASQEPQGGGGSGGAVGSPSPMTDIASSSIWFRWGKAEEEEEDMF